jgi:predicted TIM-barrel fold metal-dependent hydrolase
MRSRIALSVLTCLAVGCARGPAPGNSTAAPAAGAPAAPAASTSGDTPAAPARTEGALVALVDHHQHLVSPAGAEWLNRSPLSIDDLPADLSRLLRERGERWNDASALAKLYTEDSVVLDSFESRWLRGQPAVAGFLSTLFARAFRLTPVAFETKGSAGHITGYYTRDDSGATRYFGRFYLGLERGRDKVWRIAVETPTFPGPPMEETITGEKLVAHLDAAGIRRAVVLSDAYWFGSPRKPEPDEHAKVRAENDWTAQEVARFPDRLVAICSFNPLADYALTELERCAGNPVFKGLKLHFGSSQVDLKNPAHVEKVRQVFQAANARKLPIIVHVRADMKHYGREHAEILLNQLIAAAPDITVQIAHLWGGEGFSDDALAAYADAVSGGHPAAKNLYFDLADAALVAGGSQEILQTLATRIRQIGPERILYGSDAAMRGHPTPGEAWTAFRTAMPLTEEELRIIANNMAPYLR